MKPSEWNESLTGRPDLSSLGKRRNEWCKMADLKTRPNDGSVSDFLNGVEDDGKRRDCFELIDLMKEISGTEPQMWGSSIVGFGDYHYCYDSGREGDWFQVGFSPRKQALTIYLMTGISRYSEILDRLGKHRTGKGCLYVKRLSDVDRDALRELLTKSVEHASRSSATRTR